MKVRLAAAAGVTAALLAPAAAHAATVAVQGACFVSGGPVTVTGSGYTPNAPVSIRGGAFGSTVADAAGNFSAQVSAPFVNTVAPRTIGITATDGANPAHAAGGQFAVTPRVLNPTGPLTGGPGQKTAWRFSGFPGGTAIYGQYRFHGR